ncbi:S8 family serine peptidase, partial [Lawsonibacter sp. DFI.6.74]|nr:S8 family serine peptidase [Lawsonibacter sp. DFI.6.74]
DEEGIGTALSGICGGLGNVNNQYSGVAENSELIIVKIKKIDGFYSNSMLSAALEYAYEKAKKEKLPLIN